MKEREIQSYFNRGIPQRISYLTRDDAIGYNYREKRYWFCRYLEGVQGKILDIGCNIGNLAHLIREFGITEDNLKITGVDIADEAVQVASQRNISGTVFQVGSMENLPFDDASFDAVALVEVIEHIHNKSLSMREACRVLKPGGLLLLSTPNADCRPWQKDEKLRLLIWRLLGRPLIEKDELLTLEELMGLCKASGLDCVEGPRFYWYRPYRQMKGYVWWPLRFAAFGLLRTMKKCIEAEKKGDLTVKEQRYQCQSLLLAARKRMKEGKFESNA